MSELKRWCLVQLYNIEVRLTGEPSGTEVPHSSSAAEGVAGDEEAGLTLLPFNRAAQRLDLHGHPGQGQPGTAETGAASRYFVVHVESSPGNHTHLNAFLPCHLCSFSLHPSIQKQSMQKPQNVGMYCLAGWRTRYYQKPSPSLHFILSQKIAPR